VEAILDDLGSDLGELGDLMAEGLRVLDVEGLAAAGAGVWLDLDGAGQLLGGDQLTRMTLVPELTSPSLPGCRLERLPLGVEWLGRWGLGGVGRVPVEQGIECGDSVLEGLDQAEDSRLGIGRDLGPQVIGKWGLAAHAIGCNPGPTKAQLPTSCERLRRSEGSTGWPAG